MKVGERVRPNNRATDPTLGTVTRVREDGTVVVRWDRLYTTGCSHGGRPCSCGRAGKDTRTLFEEFPAARVEKAIRRAR